MQKSIAVGISLTADILTKIDSDRGDLSRSLYLRRLVKKAFAIDAWQGQKMQLKQLKNGGN